MNTINKSLNFGVAFLMFTSMGAAIAEEGDMTQTRDRIRTEANLQTLESEQA